MSKIEWTEKTWNPVSGCNKVSPGCKNCYAEKMHKRLAAMGQKKYSNPFLAGPVCHPDELATPLSIKSPTVFFVNSMSDLFHKDVPFDFIRQVLSVIGATPRHTYQILTKRPEVAFQFHLAQGQDWVWPQNLWLGTSCENQETANERIPLLLQIPASLLFLSLEPLLNSIDLLKIKTVDNLTFNCLESTNSGNKINWIIVGGESGAKSRPMHPGWVRSLRQQCKANETPFFFKQWGEYGYYERFPIPMEEISKVRYYWEDQGFKRIISKTPAEALVKFPLAVRKGKSKSGHLLDKEVIQEFPAR